ncbi:unnamed protein product [Paramecium sonneborni]|uniref:H-type lectin domain-containing protein n=1 Tax=Paramecium sonneborni TaxID=65129 RepID=A0A8S1QHF9_9CILI|nr:unnamed protein product [Paramecium sonneborni]
MKSQALFYIEIYKNCFQRQFCCSINRQKELLIKIKQILSHLVVAQDIQKQNQQHFPALFANIPQVILNPIVFDFGTASLYLQSIIEFQSISLTGFTLKITCTGNQMNYYRFQWFAIDDERIQVITEANADPIASKQYPIKNPNANKAIASVISFGYKGGFDVSLTITELTSTHITIGISNANANLIHLGYQTALIPEEILTQLPYRVATGFYSTQVFPIQADSYFIIQLSRMSAGSSYAFRFLIDTLTTADQIYYQTATWSYSGYPPNTIKPYWLKLTLDLIAVSMECFTVRVSKLFDHNSYQKPSFQVQFLKVTNSSVLFEVKQLQSINQINQFKSIFIKNVHQIIKRFIVKQINAIIVVELIKFIIQIIIAIRVDFNWNKQWNIYRLSFKKQDCNTTEHQKQTFQIYENIHIVPIQFFLLSLFI